MDNALQVFIYNEKKLRTVVFDGDIWFVAKDIANILSLGSRRSIDITRSLDDNEKGFCQMPTTSGVQRLAVINLTGFYSTISRCKSSEAKKFCEWVRFNVLQTSHRNNNSHSNEKKLSALPAGVLEGAKNILELTGLKGKKLALALDKVYQSYTGISAFEACEIPIETIPE